jgi:hypothetical protein
VTSSLVRRPEIFLLGLERADAAPAEIVSRPDRGVAGEAEHVGLPVTAELEHLAAGLLLHGVPRPGDAGHAGEAEGDSAAELQFQGLADLAGNSGESLLAGGMPGADEAAQRTLGLLRPAGDRVGLGAVSEIPDQVLVMPTSWLCRALARLARSTACQACACRHNLSAPGMSLRADAHAGCSVTGGIRAGRCHAPGQGYGAGRQPHDRSFPRIMPTGIRVFHAMTSYVMQSIGIIPRSA